MATTTLAQKMRLAAEQQEQQEGEQPGAADGGDIAYQSSDLALPKGKFQNSKKEKKKKKKEVLFSSSQPPPPLLLLLTSGAFFGG